MLTTTRARRMPRAVATLLMLLAPVLAGCLRYTESLTINPDDTVSGVIVIAAEESDSTGDGQPSTAADSAPPLPEPASTSDRILVTSFAHEQESGYKVTFDDASFHEVAAFTPLGADGGGALLITRYDDELTVLATLDLTYSMPAAEAAYVAEHADLSVSLEVPGEVIETNGVVHGDVINWDLTPFTVNTLSATVASPIDTAAPATGTKSIDPMWAAVLGGGALLILLLCWLLIRRYLIHPKTSRHNSPSTTRAPSPAARPARSVDSPSAGGPSVGGPSGRIRSAGASGIGVSGGSVSGGDVSSGAGPPDPFGEPDPTIEGASQASRVRPTQQIDSGGWPPPRPLWKEHQ